MKSCSSLVLRIALLLLIGSSLSAQTTSAEGPSVIDMYFQNQVIEIERKWSDLPTSRLDWENRKPGLRRQLMEMLGLWPAPERGDLQVKVTGRVERDGVVVENLHFQSLPGLYVTANFYRPAKASGRLPAVLYVCGHATVEQDGIAYGSKVRYQHHPVWFARHGYASLILDTLQLGEIEGLHHGTYREGKWWWINQGYTPAGVETWNALRAVDYLQTRADVDPDRIAMTGRSGGGITTWWAAALDDRIRVSVPVAGLTDLQNHIVDGAIEGHCDCMYFINKYRWSFSTLAALLAPRPLLLCNSDQDPIFPLDGVLRIHRDLKKQYELYDAGDAFGLTITQGPHEDTQELRIPAFHWIDRWLMGEERLIEEPARPLFSPEELKVFDVLPEDQVNTRISEVLTPIRNVDPPPQSWDAWMNLRESWRTGLEEGPFAGWPSSPPFLRTRRIGDVSWSNREGGLYRFDSQEFYPLSLWFFPGSGATRDAPVVFLPLSNENFEDLNLPLSSGEPESSAETGAIGRNLCGEEETCAFFAPRGIGPTAWNPDETVHIRRRFALLGQTLDAMRVWDIRRAFQAVQQISGMDDVRIQIRARGEAGVLSSYAAIWEPRVESLSLVDPPTTHRDGPIFPFIARWIDVPQALGMLLPERQILLRTDRPRAWSWLQGLADTVQGDVQITSSSR